MSTDPDEIIGTAIQLCESDHIRVVTRLLETLPDEPPGLSLDDPEFLAELERRADDSEGAIPISQLWNQD